MGRSAQNTPDLVVVRMKGHWSCNGEGVTIAAMVNGVFA